MNQTQLWDQLVNHNQIRLELVQLIQKGNPNGIEALLHWNKLQSKPAPNLIDYGLRVSAERGFLNWVHYFIDLGANLHSDDDYALKKSAYNGHLPVVRALIELGAHLHAEDDGALRKSAYNGHTHVVEYLLQSGANIHAKNDYAICWSAIKGHLSTVQCLAYHGANLTVGMEGADTPTPIITNITILTWLQEYQRSQQEQSLLSQDITSALPSRPAGRL